MKQADSQAIFIKKFEPTPWAYEPETAEHVKDNGHLRAHVNLTSEAPHFTALCKFHQEAIQPARGGTEDAKVSR